MNSKKASTLGTILIIVAIATTAAQKSLAQNAPAQNPVDVLGAVDTSHSMDEAQQNMANTDTQGTPADQGVLPPEWSTEGQPGNDPWGMDVQEPQPQQQQAPNGNPQVDSGPTDNSKAHGYISINGSNFIVKLDFTGSTQAHPGLQRLIIERFGNSANDLTADELKLINSKRIATLVQGDRIPVEILQIKNQLVASTLETNLVLQDWNGQVFLVKESHP